jgi:hypothetical protein
MHRGAFDLLNVPPTQAVGQLALLHYRSRTDMR